MEREIIKQEVVFCVKSYLQEGQPQPQTRNVEDVRAGIAAYVNNLKAHDRIKYDVNNLWNISISPAGKITFSGKARTEYEGFIIDENHVQLPWVIK